MILVDASVSALDTKQISRIHTPKRSGVRNVRSRLPTSSPTDKVLSPITKALIGGHGNPVSRKDRAKLLSCALEFPKSKLFDQLSENDKENVPQNTQVSKPQLLSPVPCVNKKGDAMFRQYKSPSDLIISPISAALIGTSKDIVSNKIRANIFRRNIEDDDLFEAKKRKPMRSKLDSKPSFTSNTGNVYQSSTVLVPSKDTRRRTPKKARCTPPKDRQGPFIKCHSPSDKVISPISKVLLGYGGVKATNKQKAEQLRTNFSKQFSDQRTLQQRRGKSKIQLRKQTPNPKRSVSKKTSFSLYIEKNNKNNKKVMRRRTIVRSENSLKSVKFAAIPVGENAIVSQSHKKSSRSSKSILVSKRREGLRKPMGVLSPMPVNVHR